MTTQSALGERTPLDAGAVFAALETWIKQRPGLDPRDYGFDANGRAAYRSEIRQIGKDRQRAMAALDEARGLVPAKPELLQDAFRAYSGRLEWKLLGEYTTPHFGLSYCTGQYWPTEYRKAAAAVLESYIAAWKQAYAAEHPPTFTYRSIADVRAANQSIGNHWFGRSTMRWFNTKIESGLVACDYGPDGVPRKGRFITSERMDENHPRRYSIREAQPDGTIDTVGEFQAYLTRDAARAALLSAGRDKEDK